MPRKQFSSEQIITKLREAEVLLSQGMTVIEAARQLDISEQTYYRWRKEYGGLDTNQARKLKALEKHKSQLEHIPEWREGIKMMGSKLAEGKPFKYAETFKRLPLTYQ